MARTADITVNVGAADNFSGAGTIYVVKTPAGVLYQLCIEGSSDVVFRKSTDDGITWSATTVVFSGTTVNLAIWYDRWSNINAGLIHCTYVESVTDDVLYRTIDTESSDALSTQTVAVAGSSTLAGGHISVTRARGGNVFCHVVIDAGTEEWFLRLPNANVPDGAWDAARTIDENQGTQDQMILVPGFAADNQDIMGIFWDASANEISRKIHDDSANSWAEASISTGMVDQAATTAFPHFAAAVDLTNSRIIVVAWNGVDTANADLLGWIVTESAITAFTTPVVSNGTDDQGLCAIGIDTDTGYWYVAYAGKSDGSETYNTSLNVYYKVSTDAGATWGAENQLSSAARAITWLICCPRFTNPFGVMVQNTETPQVHLRYTAQISQPRASMLVGI